MHGSEEVKPGLFKGFTNLVGNMFVSQSVEDDILTSENDAALLALYEAVHCNRNFFSVLSQIMSNDYEACNQSDAPIIERTAPVQSKQSKQDEIDQIQSENLLATFLRFTSVSFLYTKSKVGQMTAKLCLIILNCIVEDQCANAFLHDSNMSFTVPIYKMNLYHRKVDLTTTKVKPLASTVLDLMVEFIVTHMTKNFALDLYNLALGIVHRSMSFQKKVHIRLQHDWRALWTSLMSLIKLFISNESHLLPTHNIFNTAIQVINIFNLFITYGDTFLPSPTSYDELYYEIIRVHQLFDNLYSLALRYISADSDLKTSANKLCAAIVNVRAIIHHFSPKIDALATMQNKSNLEEAEVYEVIRENYETLTLKLLENLDSYQKYNEQSSSNYFISFSRSIVLHVRSCIAIDNLKQLSLLQEFSTIS
jgi:hypothetical protein